jgi:myo-inositol-1(or 4)-monophosphatase
MRTELLHAAIAAAREAGAAIRDVWDRGGQAVDHADGRALTPEELAAGRGDPLTEADTAADAILSAHLRGRFAGFGWLSEETADDQSRRDSAYAWIVDPLDGTREFTLRVPEFVVSVGLVHEGRPVLGVLHNPITGELYAGVVGEGATLDGVPIRVSGHPAVQGARVVCSRTEMKKGMFAPWEDRLALVPLGSVAYKFGKVAAGQAEATFTPQPRNAWDIAGGVALVEAAGGRTSDCDGNPFACFAGAGTLAERGVCATNGHVHAGILGLVRA